MRVFTTTGFQGHYPVGTAAVIVAESPEAALVLLVEKLKHIGLYRNEPFDRVNTHLRVESLQEVDLTVPSVDVLQNGDY